MKIDILKLAAAILACELAGVVGAVFTTSSITTWYAGLQKPAFTPPGWVFGPVWITLYALMGISFYLFWKGSPGKNRKTGIFFFGVQLALNVLWSVVFFGMHSPFYALVVIVGLWLAIVLTILEFRRVPLAAWPLVPYIAWVSLAAVLNYYVYILNP